MLISDVATLMIIAIVFLKTIATSMVVERLIDGDIVQQRYNAQECGGKKIEGSRRCKCNESRQTFYSDKHTLTNCYGVVHCTRMTGQFHCGCVQNKQQHQN